MAYDSGDMKPTARREVCGACQGAGQVVLYGFNCSGQVRPHSTSPCTWCDGRGHISPDSRRS